MKKEEKKEDADKIARVINPARSITTKPKKITVEMTVHRAATNRDEHYGIIAAYHKNPIIHIWMQLCITYRGLVRKYGHSINK